MDRHQCINTEKWNNLWKSMNGNEYPHEQLVKYVNITAHFPAMRALDIGFGSGVNMKFLYEKGFLVHGIEVSKSAIDKVTEKTRKWSMTFDLIAYESPFLPFSDCIFGFICSVEAIYYNIELESVIDEIYRILVPGGKIYITFRTPNHDVIKYHARFVGETLMEWNEDMPEKEMAGIRFRCFKNKKDLYPLFSKFSNVRVDTLWTDLLGRRFESLIVTGEKNT